MGIINVTSDSFYAASRAQSLDAVCALAEKHVRHGAQFLDVGASSSRPGAELSNPKAEWTHLSGIFSRLRKEFPDVYLSVDTYWAEVAQNSVNEGADMVNDISAGSLDAALLSTVARLRVPYILMHMQGNPQTMQTNPHYENVVAEVQYFLAQKQSEAYALGCSDVLLDPGFGFGKTLEHNYALLKGLSEFKNLKAPLVVGVSRKSMITKLLNISAAEALNGTTALHMLALLQGADILRVHDTAEASQCISVFEAYRNARATQFM
jgi:dihydropteroate synthase